MRIRNWHFAIHQHREMIPRSMISVQDPAMLEQLSKNVTRQGMTNVTLNYLRVCDVSNTFLSIMINLICCDVNHIHFDLYSRTDLMLLLDPGEGGGYTPYIQMIRMIEHCVS